MDIAGMSAIITGAAQGMGRCFARELAAGGAGVALCDVNAESLKRTAADISRKTDVKVIYETLDVSAEDQVSSFVARAEKELEAVDILINNAAIHPLHPIEDVTEEEWDRVLAVDLKACFLFSRAVLPGMRKRRFGRIINMASEAGKNGGTICGIHYAAAKGGGLAFTRNLAKQVGADGITVNAIAPGRIATPMARAVSDSANLVYVTRSAVKRLGTPQDVAAAVLFLADRGSSFITGETLNVNGGTLMD